MELYMEPYKIALFGSRRIENSISLGEDLKTLFRFWFSKESYLQFYIGRNGDFDILAASIIQQIRKEYEHVLCELILILPYTVKDMEYYVEYYDQIIIPDEVYGVHPKRVITERNKWMVEQADFVLVYTRTESGGAYRALEYAKKIDRPFFQLLTIGNRDDFDEYRGLCRITEDVPYDEHPSPKSMDQYKDYYREYYNEYSEYNGEDF